MKIAVIVSEFPSVSETFVLSQVTGLLDLGHAVDLYAAHATADWTVHAELARYRLRERTRYVKPLPVVKGRARRIARALGILLAQSLRRPQDVLRWLRAVPALGAHESLNRLFAVTPFWRGNYDVVHCHFGPNGNAFLFLKALTRAKLLCTFHGYDVSSFVVQKGPDVYAELFRQADLCLPISDRWRQRLAELGCDPRKLVVHRMGIDTQSLRPRASDNGYDRPLRLLTVARLVEKKGIEDSIRAVARVAASFPRLEYRIVGGGPLEPRLRQVIEELGIGQQVNLLGPVGSERVRRLMEESDLVVLASVTAANGDQEGIPLSLMEAHAAGLPVVATRHGGIPELVADGVSGWLVPEHDVAALADRIATLAANPEQRRRMGAAGRRIVEQHYDVTRLNRRLAALMTALVKTGRPPAEAPANALAENLSRPATAPDISVILATRNRAERLRECLAYLAAQDTGGRFTYEVLVVDNGSTDATKPLVEAQQAAFPAALRYLYEGRAGKPWALNAGMAAAAGQVFAFIDDDVLATPGWLSALWTCLQEEQVDGVSGKIAPRWLGVRPAWLPEQVVRSGGAIGCVDHGPNRRRSRDGDEECRWVGGNLAVRRTAAQRAGDYDVRLTRGQDTEYYWRFIQRGLAVCYEPAALVYHQLEPERVNPAYFRRWYHRTGHYRAYRLPWKASHLLTIVPLWWYALPAKALGAWLGAAVRRRPWWERFRQELALREYASTWWHRLQLWPRWGWCVVTGRRHERP